MKRWTKSRVWCYCIILLVFLILNEDKVETKFFIAGCIEATLEVGLSWSGTSISQVRAVEGDGLAGFRPVYRFQVPYHIVFLL